MNVVESLAFKKRASSQAESSFPAPMSVQERKLSKRPTGCKTSLVFHALCTGKQAYGASLSIELEWVQASVAELAPVCAGGGRWSTSLA